MDRLRAAGALLRLLAALVRFAVGFSWARCRAAARFRRGLLRQGVPPEVARALSREYRDGLKLTRLRGGGRGRT